MDGTPCRIIDVPRGCLVLQPPTQKTAPRRENGSGGPVGPAAVSNTKEASCGRAAQAKARSAGMPGDGKVWVEGAEGRREQTTPAPGGAGSLAHLG